MQGLVGLVGHAAAMEILLEGRILNAAEAKDMGPGEPRRRRRQGRGRGAGAARRIADGARCGALAQEIRAAPHQPRAIGKAERSEAYACYDTEDFREGVAASSPSANPTSKEK